MDSLKSNLANCSFVKCLGNTASGLYEQYKNDLIDLLDKDAPKVSRTFIKGPAEWLSDSYLLAKAVRRQFERIWHKDKLWQVLHSALHSSPESVFPSHESHKCLANHFVTFFSDKITKIRDLFSSTDSFRLPPPPDLPKFDSFRTVSDVEIHKTLMKSPTKSCLLDPFPTFLVKECLDILLPLSPNLLIVPLFLPTSKKMSLPH